MRVIATIFAAATICFAAFDFAHAQTPATNPAQSAPHEGDIVPPPGPRDRAYGISGPGAKHGDQWSRYNAGATGSAVTSGLIPNLKPLIPDTQLRDTIVILGGDGNYYMTGSSGADIWDFNDGIELWRSPDLKKWDYLGEVWSFDKDGTWEKDWRWHRHPVRAIWAPEIHYIKRLNNYFLAISMPPGNRGILKSTTGKPEGPYVNALANDGFLKGGIDSTLFEDDDAKVYFTSGGASTLMLMNDDMSGFVGEPQHIEFEKPADGSWTRNSIAMEGASLFKRNGIYYLGGAAFYKGRYSSVVAMSDHILGPYKNWEEAVPCGGGTDYFQDKEGNWWDAYFGNDNQSPFREKPAIVKVDFDPAGLIHVAKKQPDFVLADSTSAIGPSLTVDLSKSPPPMGWSSWSSTWAGGGAKMNEDYIKAQADVMADKLKSSGFVYINLDDGWSQGFDDHGRLQPNPRKFPDGIAGLATYVHEKGLKLGIYMTPGLRVTAWQANGTVAGTDIHLQDIADTNIPGNTENKGNKAYRLDYAKPGAKEYVQSYVDMLASWGVDYIKFDFVGPGGGNVKADTRDDIKQWHEAIQKNGRPMWLELSNSLKIDNIETWKAHSNGWRIENDVESYGKDGHLTRWAKVALRFNDAPKWASFAGPGNWNDLDSLEIGNGDNDGLKPDERRTVMTLWAVSCSPLILGSDLTKLDDDDLALLTNSEVIAVDQAGHVATPLSQKDKQQVWRVKNPDGSFTVALFNLGDTEAKVFVSWSDLGLSGPAAVRDLWMLRDLGKFDANYQATLASHACQLLRVDHQNP